MHVRNRAQRRGRKLALIGAATFGGLVLGTVGAAAGDAPVADGQVDAIAAPSTTGFDVQALDDSEVVISEVSETLKAALAATTTTTTAPPETTTTTAPPPVVAAAEPEPEPEPEPAPAPAPAPAPEPAPEPAPAPAPSGSAEEAIAAWFPDVYDQAVRVASCESGMNPGAVSPGGGNHGLFQINNVHRSSFESVTGQPWSQVYDAYANAQYARHLYDSSGWQPWACRP